MIISASYKTDIPAFYGEWLVNRLCAGYCMMRNPLNRRPIRVPLDRSAVDGIVFWTKNARPFLDRLKVIADMGYPFTFQYTINGYSASLEHHVVDWKKSVEAAWMLAERYGPRCVVWRYDTIIYSQETPPDFHVANFSRIAAALEGATDEVVVSFLQLYRKTVTNMDDMARRTGNKWWNPSLQDKRDLAQRLFVLASEHRMQLTICSQAELLSVQKPSKCVDAQRLSDVAGHAIRAPIKANRPGCECADNRDIGDYDTCPHGCVYCYAVRSQTRAVARFRTHNPESEFLYDDPDAPAPRPDDAGVVPTLPLEWS
jgi:hypothetical protein